MSKIDFSIVAAIYLLLYLLFHKRVRNSIVWQATVTPLASIIGSGFLVVAPLLYSHFGMYSPIAMLALAVLGFLVGNVIRGNILSESISPESRLDLYFSRTILFIAYIVSVAFYIKLLSAFFIYGIGVSQDISIFLERILSTSILIFIGLSGYLSGFSRLERIEEFAVNGKLAIIVGLIVGLLGYNYNLFQSSTWILSEAPQLSWNSVRVLMGSIIVIQGFETSKFLQKSYSKQICNKSMKNAQLISAAIYLVFVSLMMVVIGDRVVTTDTAIIDLSAKVSIILPVILTIAACLSQFSAAIADTIGAGGLLNSLSNKFSLRWAYLTITLAAVSLVWLTNVFQIISIASILLPDNSLTVLSGDLSVNIVNP
jgi:hypothetical protein